MHSLTLIRLSFYPLFSPPHKPTRCHRRAAIRGSFCQLPHYLAPPPFSIDGGHVSTMTSRPLLFLIYFLLPCISRSSFSPSRPPCLPHPVDILWLPAAKPPCFHPGQPIFDWPRRDNCTWPDEVHSDYISVAEDGTVLAKKRLCFYYAYEVIPYSYRIGDLKDSSSFRLGHSVFSKQRRFKRWLRRRNPNSASIHFQHER